MGTSQTKEYKRPRIPYDEVESTIIRDEIRDGVFEDDTHRLYVNDLVYVEWYTTGGLGPNSTGLSAAGASRKHWRVATKYPEAYDRIRRELDADTRGQYTVGWYGDEDLEERRRWAKRHRREWEAVGTDTDRSEPAAIDEVPLEDRPSFPPFRFPELPYDGVQSEFVRDAIRGGSFENLEYRQEVNRLVYIEAWTREPERLTPNGYPPVRPWIVAAKEPRAFDRIRTELGAPTRSDLERRSSPELSRSEYQIRRGQDKQAWQRVRDR